ncbi:general secretion pathway protein GspB [Marinobacter sp. F4216]|uniref:general secretion pathway protein GspB n=1 Tax=Marinobacter sp. F4216 TaxID=2874281 RepID=UPI001CBC2B89|nr:general secretion pathway protein GspB [Marinobacter sp. F4216]MBZ2167909.1 general secretion pathway protein GspB [Marinobacter sp. F4216]
MSYILDALRKSETERRQGKVPDLGQQVQLIHKPKKKSISPVVWLSIALLVNAGIVAGVFWQRSAPAVDSETVMAVPKKGEPETHSPSPAVSKTSVERMPEGRPESVPVSQSNATVNPVETATRFDDANPEVIKPGPQERPVIITPSSQPERSAEPVDERGPAERVPHLVELPLSFQRSIPDLTFNSHIHSSDPFASRVMINNQYLRRGDTFSGVEVEDITEEGVILSKQGQRFRVGIVRDWVSPR